MLEEMGDVPMKLESFVNMVRGFMRDHKELNRLISGEESSNRQIVFAIVDTIEDFNKTPPFTRFTLANFPDKSLLLRGTVATVLESVGLLQTRNHLPFSDGGLQVAINDKTDYIQRWIALYRDTYERKKERLKVALNLEGGWGDGIHSEYLFTSSYYGSW
jgi:hypothetical protein